MKAELATIPVIAQPVPLWTDPEGRMVCLTHKTGRGPWRKLGAFEYAETYRQFSEGGLHFGCESCIWSHECES